MALQTDLQEPGHELVVAPRDSGSEAGPVSGRTDSSLPPTSFCRSRYKACIAQAGSASAGDAFLTTKWVITMIPALCVSTLLVVL